MTKAERDVLDHEVVSETTLEQTQSRLDWDEYFLGVVAAVAKRSTCLRIPDGCGAVLVQKNRIISTGYAGSLPGLPHCTDVGCLIDPATGGCVRTVHAETNAILHAAHHTQGATLYCTMSPCLACFKALAASGVSRVVFNRWYRITDPQKEFARQLGISMNSL